MIRTINLILRTMVLEYFNNSLYSKNDMRLKFGFYLDKKKSAEKGNFLQFRVFFNIPPHAANPRY